MEPIGDEVRITWRGRRARAFVPGRLADRSFDLASDTVARTARAQALVEQGAESMPDDHAPLARLLLRADGVASSFIEGVGAPALDIVLAETGSNVATPAAGWVAANLTATEDAVADAHDGPLHVDDLLRWHRTLMTGSPLPDRHVGVFRDEQGWIGGTSPLDANLVTPPPDRVPGLIDDLVAFVNEDNLDPVTATAVAHAQFELIHPFADGNGRIGRVLVAWMLVRRLGLVSAPPVSIRIAADVGGYTSGLVLYQLGDLDTWVRWFADAVAGAGRRQVDLVAEVEELRATWRARLAAPRPGRSRLRGDAAAWQVLDLLPRSLVLTSTAVAQALGVPPKTASAALADLVEAGVLVDHGTAPAAGPGRPRRLYVSEELLGLTGSLPRRA